MTLLSGTKGQNNRPPAKVSNQTQRILFVHRFPFVSQIEAAAAFRQRGFRVEFVTVPPGSLRGWLNLLHSRLVFHKVHHLLDADQRAAITIGAQLKQLTTPPTIEIICFDVIGHSLAEERPKTLVAGLIDPIWYDKWYLAQELERLSIPGPQLWRKPVSDKFPVLVKANITSGGTGVRLCASQVELEEAWIDLGGPEGKAFVSEFLPGTHYGLTGVAIDGRIVNHALFEYIPHPDRPLAPSLYQRIVDDPADVIPSVRKLLAASGYTGIFGVQQIVGEDGRGRTIDLNPRFTGNWAALEALGYNLMDIHVANLQRLPLPTPVGAKPGSVGESVQLGTIPPLDNWSQLRGWNAETKRLLRKRRQQFGWRIAAWGTVSRWRTSIRTAAKLLRGSA